MYVLKTTQTLSSKQKEIIRESFKERTGADCIILDCGLTLEKVQIKSEQPLFKRLFG